MFLKIKNVKKIPTTKTPDIKTRIHQIKADIFRWCLVFCLFCVYLIHGNLLMLYEVKPEKGKMEYDNCGWIDVFSKDLSTLCEFPTDNSHQVWTKM